MTALLQLVHESMSRRGGKTIQKNISKTTESRIIPTIVQDSKIRTHVYSLPAPSVPTGPFVPTGLFVSTGPFGSTGPFVSSEGPVGRLARVQRRPWWSRACPLRLGWWPRRAPPRSRPCRESRFVRLPIHSFSSFVFLEEESSPCCANALRSP